jgi:hypothetical protein
MPRAIPNATQTLEVQTGAAICNAEQELACALVCLTVLLKCGGASDGKVVDYAGGRCTEPENGASPRDRTVQLWILWNLDAWVSSRHTKSVPANGHTFEFRF